MNKRFELWLDESGTFENEAKLKEENKKGSLIGGLLVESGLVESIDFDSLITDGLTHAMDFSDEQKKEYVIPVLEQVKELGAIQVFFENATYVDKETGTQLYLNIMAEGLLQLLMKLDAMYESVELSVLIAQRQEVSGQGTPEMQSRRIDESEYIATLNALMDRKKKFRRVLLDKDTAIRFRLDSAYRVDKLQLADFCCNTRLTRDSHAFAGMRDRVLALYDNAYIFTLTEKNSVNYINRCLIRQDVSEAIFELYTTADTIKDETKAELIGQITDHMKNSSYRIQKSQLKQCAQDIASYTQAQNDYHILENLYHRINTELVSVMEENGIPCDGFKFSVLLSLADALLREGNIIKARAVIEEAEAVQKRMDDSLENLLTYHQILEKKSLLLIDEYDFEGAAELLQKAGRMYEFAMKELPAVEIVGERFPEFKSEYYGDILCMEIYAMMFMQKRNPELYDKLTKLSDLALKQYPEYQGELERHLQYRSHIEMAAGNYVEAVLRLYESVPFEEKQTSKACLVKFLDRICQSHQTIGCQYYLMYYLLIMSEAKKDHEDALADAMFDALTEQKELLRYGGIDPAATDGGMLGIDTKKVSMKSSGKTYHPTEVILWKYASYLRLSGKINTANTYYSRAVTCCFANEESYNLRITGLAVCAEKIGMLVSDGDTKEAKKCLEDLNAKCRALLREELPAEPTKRLSENMAGLLSEAYVDGKWDEDKLRSVSEMITY